MLSATYRQSSVADAAARERDPVNEWLARGPALSAVGRSRCATPRSPRAGCSCRRSAVRASIPYQPAGLWEALATRNATTYTQGKGDDLHRRSLYTVWKRSSPPPSAISFDAAERLFCTVNRQRTSTPLQALVLLNDPQFVEAARALAARMMREGGASVEARITLRASRRDWPVAGRGRACARSAQLYREELDAFRRDRGCRGRSC